MNSFANHELPIFNTGNSVLGPGSWVGFSETCWGEGAGGKFKGIKGKCCPYELTNCSSLVPLVPAISQETYMKVSGKTTCATGKAE